MVTGGADKTLPGKRHMVLLAMVGEFIATAEPVGSKQIASRHRLGIKSAMVRNMMVELEGTGYLSQPHTSAGRVPTDKAFRYYVDHTAPIARIGFEDRSQIELHYSGHGRDLPAIMRDTPRLLALLTGQAALVIAPRLEAVQMERVNFVRVRECEVLAVFVASAGGVQNHLITTVRDHSQDDLDRIARYLNDVLQGRTLGEARTWIENELKQERAHLDRLVHDALELGAVLAERVRGQIDVYVEGSAHALEQPEFADPTRMRELLRALEDKTALLDLLERSLKQQSVMISIGKENGDPRLAPFSVVAAPYVGGTRSLGSLAVVGPVRMDYERVIPLVDYAARALSRAIE